MSTSALREGLTPREIARAVKDRMDAGEDLYRIDRGAFADLAYMVRPGPRVVTTVEVLSSILHPDTCGLPDATCALRVA